MDRANFLLFSEVDELFLIVLSTKKCKNDDVISKMYIQHTLKCINIYINPFPSKLQNLKVTVGCAAVVSYGL